MAQEYTFGANILENLTTGMYRNPLVLFREYIQNGCDSIDKAVKFGLLESKKQGRIEISLDDRKRSIEIEDNGMGISAADFERILGNIADSDKTLGEDKGFRGIGRLCGLAYCDKLIFRTKFKGESVVSVMECDAKKMRTMLQEHQNKKQKYLAVDILKQIYKFSSEVIDNPDEHFFSVRLELVDKNNNNLLDIIGIKEYLSFVAPVPYQNAFIFRTSIYDKAQELGVAIDEYTVTVNDEPIFKKYVTVLKDKSNQKYDDVVDVAFKVFYDQSKRIIAWMWVGVFQFKQAIPKINVMRGLRLRKENIQIGDEDALQKLFKEDRGNSYFIGEVFAIDSNLIPNSQRDYFNQNEARENFEVELKRYFDDDLYRTYYNASAINSAYKKIEVRDALREEYAQVATAGFAGMRDKEQREDALRKAEDEAKRAEEEIKKKIDRAEPDTLQSKVALIIQTRRTEEATRKPLLAVIPLPVVDTSGEDDDVKTYKPSWRTDKLSRLNKQERKLVGRIFDIIFATIEDKSTAEKVVGNIEDELK